MNIFEARKDFSVKFITGLFIFIIHIPLIMYFLMPGKTFTVLAVFIILLAALLITFIYAPKSYEIDDESVIIKRRAGDIAIYFDSIEEVKELSGDELKGSLRLFGSSGLFGFFGIFYKKGWGRFTAYCSNSSDLVFIRTEKIWLISPHQKEIFVSVLKEKLKK